MAREGRGEERFGNEVNMQILGDCLETIALLRKKRYILEERGEIENHW